jgi:hypothetical protein
MYAKGDSFFQNIGINTLHHIPEDHSLNIHYCITEMSQNLILEEVLFLKIY